MAVIKGVGAYLRDALDAACHLIADGVVLIQHTHEPVVDDIAGVVLDHAYLLPDDALLLLHGLVGEVGGGHELQQHTQVFLKARGTVKVICGHAAGGEGVGLGAVGGENAEGVVPVGHIKHLVLEEVSYARGSIVPAAV